MTWLVVHNPGAGRRDDVATRLERALASYEVTHRTVVSDSADHLARLVGEALGEGVSRFAAVGGDGTAHMVLNAMMSHQWETPPVLAIVPAGSGSDFIRTFALPRRLEESVGLLATHDVYRCDIGRIVGAFGSRWFLNAANFGLAAVAAARAKRLPRRWGGLRYTAAFWLELARFAPGAVEVGTSRRRLANDGAINIVISNGQFFGGGLNVAPQAAVMDGVLDVEIFSGPRRNAFAVMPRVVRGLHLRHRAVSIGRGAELEVVVPDDWPIEADGELLGVGSAVVSVAPGAIDFKI